MNTITAGDQVNPVVAVLPSGGHVVAWTTRQSLGVSAQFYDASGAKSGSELALAPGFSAGGIAALADGTLVVSLTHGGVDAQHYPTSAYFARYNANGAPLGAPVLVDGSGNYDASVSGGAVFALPGGGFALVDTTTSRPTPVSTITHSIRVFDSSGTPVASIAAGENFRGQIQAMGSGGYVVANDPYTGPGPSRISWQTFDAQGNRVDGAQFNSIYGQINYSAPTVVALAGGGAVVVWNAASSANGVTTTHWQAQLVDASGHAAGAPIDWGYAGQSAPQLAPLAQGGFLATWAVSPPGGPNPYEVYAQAFDASAQPAGSVQHVGTLGYYDATYVATGTPDNGFLLDWQVKADGEDIFEQKFDVMR